VPKSVASDSAANNSPERTAELPAAWLAVDALDPVMRQFYTPLDLWRYASVRSNFVVR
jgi:hypothetical protein